MQNLEKILGNFLKFYGQYEVKYYQIVCSDNCKN